MTGSLPLLTLDQDETHNLPVAGLRAPNTAGVISDALLVFGFLQVGMKFWRKPALQTPEITERVSLTGSELRWRTSHFRKNSPIEPFCTR